VSIKSGEVIEDDYISPPCLEDKTSHSPSSSGRVGLPDKIEQDASHRSNHLSLPILSKDINGFL